MQQRATPRKRAVNLSIDVELLDAAKEAGTNLSRLLEATLREHLRAYRRQQWYERNRAAIEAGNAELERNGPWYTPDWLRE